MRWLVFADGQRSLDSLMLSARRGRRGKTNAASGAGVALAETPPLIAVGRVAVATTLVALFGSISVGMGYALLRPMNRGVLADRSPGS